MRPPIRVSPAIGAVASKRDDRPFGQIVAMSAVAAERDGAVVVACRLDCGDLHTQAAFRAGDVRSGRIGLMPVRRRNHDRTLRDVRLRNAGCARSESGTTHFSVTSRRTMANRHRGEIEANIGGTRRRLPRKILPVASTIFLAASK